MTRPHKNIVGERVQKARKGKKPPMTQAELVARIDVLGVHMDRVALSKIETRRRLVTDFELKAIASALGVSVEWLLGD